MNDRELLLAAHYRAVENAAHAFNAAILAAHRDGCSVSFRAGWQKDPARLEVAGISVHEARP